MFVPNPHECGNRRGLSSQLHVKAFKDVDRRNFRWLGRCAVISDPRTVSIRCRFAIISSESSPRQTSRPIVSQQLFGRGSWIRTNDLQYPKLPRYQAALYPDRLGNDVVTRLRRRQQGGLRSSHLRLNRGWATRSPGAMPYFCAVPAITSSTPFAGPPDEMILVDSGSVFSAILRMRPSARMKIMSSGM